MNDYTIVGWRAWAYVKGAIERFDSATTKWPDLPTEGFLGFVTYCRTRPYRNIRCGVSLYWHDPKTQVYGADDRADAIIRPDLDRKWVKKGLWVEENQWRQVSKEMHNATESPDESLRVDKVR